jgi:hypothetical protein
VADISTARVGWRGGVAVLAVLAALGQAVGGGGSSPRGAASLGRSDGSAGSTSAGGARSAATSQPKDDNPTGLVDAWASCMRSHGVPGQTDPVIDSHGVINITAPPLGPGEPGPSANAHDAGGACSRYLVKAQTELRAEDPVADPQGVPTSTAVPFANCMRANGVPDYPYPSGPDDSTTNFNGTGVNPNSPNVVKVNDYCGKKLELPTWWINGWGPPGDISVKSSGLPGAAGDCAYSKKGCGPHGPLVPTPGGSGGASGVSGLGTGG